MSSRMIERPELQEPDDWDISRQVTAARKGGDAGAAIALAEHGLERFPDSEPLRSSLGWALYDRDIKTLGAEPTIEQLRAGWRTCRDLREILSEDLHGDYSAWVPAVLRLGADMLDHAGADKPALARCVRELLQPMDADQLSREGFRGGPSPVERHALILTKALFRLGEWDALPSVCETLLPRMPPRSDAELWLRHRASVALLELDDATAAAPHVAFVLARKPNEWWARRNDARVKAATGDVEGAIRAFAAALKGGALHMKTAAMVDLAKLLRTTGKVADADRHHRVARQIRVDQGWRSTSEIDAPLESDGVATSEDRRRLEQLWEELTIEPRHHGRIRTVFENGSSGFLALDGGELVYFAMPGERPAPSEGTSVTCRVVDSYDRKKQRESRKAIELRVGADG